MDEMLGNDNDIDIYAVIVLYNKHFEDSITFQSICNIKGIHLIICDNSTNDFGNSKIRLKYNDIIYIGMKGNQGLSKAYNRAIDAIASTGILCLFDDDTAIPEDYFAKMIQHFQMHDAEIALPLVYDEVGLLSPSIITKYQVRRANQINEITQSNITAINSGMAIDLNVFCNYRYDENYFLDYIDHAFIREMKRQNKKIAIVETKINQKFSANEKSNLNSSLIRFKIYKNDFFLFCADTFYGKLYAAAHIMKRWLYLNIYLRMKIAGKEKRL